MKRVLILDANQRSALATVRSLGRQGLSAITADDTSSALAGCSRYSAQYLQYPSPRKEPTGFIELITQFLNDQHIDVVLPMTELTTELLLEARSDFPQTVLPFAPLSTIQALSNKSSLLRLADSLQVPCPETWHIDSIRDLPGDLAQLPYPLILKPSKSWIRLADQWQRVGVRLARSPEIAQNIINTDPVFQTHPFLLQRCVQGIGQGVFALYDQGKPVAFFSHRRLREKPPWGGVSVLSESTSPDKTLLAHTRALLDAVKWHGIAMVEFKVAADGTPYLMEINTRFWGSLQLAIDAGVDFPGMLCKAALGQPVQPVTAYRIGQRLRWLLGDLDNLYLTFKDGQRPLSDKLMALARFFIPHPFSTRHEIDRWRDLGPFWWELRHYMHNH